MGVSIQQAAANRFARWLEQKLPGVKVMSRWPTGGFKLPNKAITVVCAGPRQDQPIERRFTKLVPVSSDSYDGIVQVDACFQPMQLDVWTHSWDERDEIIAALDVFLRTGAADLPGVVNPFLFGTSTSVYLKLEDGWEVHETFVDYKFENPDLDETGTALDTAKFRASYRGGAHFMLTIPARVARQKVVNFSLLLNETDAAAEREVSIVSE